MAKLFYPPEDNGLQKTLDSVLSTGVTASLTLNNANKIQNKPGVIVIDRIDSTGTLKDAADREYIIYTAVSGVTLTGLTRGSGGSTDQDHSVGAVVEFVPDVNIFQNITDALALAVDADDISSINTTNVVTPAGTQTLTNKTLTSPIVGTAILDTNGNEIIKTPATASAVNEVTITNSATTLAPAIEATGGDTNIHLFVNGKGTGKVVSEAPIYGQNLTSNFITSASSSEQVVGSTPLLITLPIIKKTCKIKITICFYTSFATGNTNISGTVGTNSNGVGNTVVANVYSGSSTTNRTFSNVGLASVDLSTQNYAAFTCTQDSSNTVNLSANGYRTGIIVEIFG